MSRIEQIISDIEDGVIQNDLASHFLQKVWLI